MKYLRVGPAGQERPIAESGGRFYDLSAVTGDITGAFLAAGGVASVEGLSEIDISGQRRGAPIARPGVVLCVGQNYAAHAAESGAEPPQTPIMFYKAPNTIVGPDDDVLIPRGSQRTDWEVELGVVIGRTARYLDSPADAAAHIAGYVLSNDVSERAFQLDQSGGQWSKGKSCETFNPLGPFLVTPDEVPGPLRLRSWVNGAPRQDSSTADMIFGVDYLIWHLSQYTVLEPGDLINTGTPEGVALSGRFPYLAAGDVVEIEIDGLGRQRSIIRGAS
ncbi:2-keto-4-pentenoate hydratase/2-oxohepta-3-ene-1,7-dioic acid hydratase in catechol pathway [Actinoplanes lutulentus]|uniref:2-keto-4-pentenoate hydratase/2-oxohepta-3-ene-1,7-dioic acid hydratase in catechol pathway n=1 Tax=Actinoplanes lutulentus TaxID=1287878 RepID=A0A327YX71_9ACTN|nr:fumarylacetoacetate hydrolase family protein [Actinoplanes lutulentus]MBB2948754.1 2-keto-4-pentenoate hydratase/2-oxohepta-3-ene-1,7-dioic acid hydratase in catechol pathway [Actinoplanes lutulentus]RAK26176.1 2-keto-4-pentenoate hydratase/2-oxohepta-3-ene-1,7-dioic acid hydratase in catechol pathway [Actinoplanes lutulentus]